MSKGLIVAPMTFRDVCVVITTYRPDELFPVRVQQIRDQVGAIIVVDDGNCEENKYKLKTWFNELQTVIVQHNGDNVGIAASLNNGISLAKRLGFKWILTLDDDSLVMPDLVERLLIAVNSIKLDKPVGIIGMSWVEANGVPVSKNRSQEVLFSEKRGIITSGSFFSIDTYDQVGPFREEFFIDSVDYDFCLRARARGFAVIKLNEVGFEHSLGCNEVFCIMGLNIVADNHEAFRTYYKFRNSTVLALEYLKDDPLYSMAVLVGHTKTILKILLFEKNKRTKMAHALAGLKDGLARNLGRRIVEHC